MLSIYACLYYDLSKKEQSEMAQNVKMSNKKLFVSFYSKIVVKTLITRSFAKHYENMPMQYTDFSEAVKLENFQ